MRKSDVVRKTLYVLTILLHLAALSFHSRGAAGDVDLSFDPGSGSNGYVQAAVVQPDGRYVVTGGMGITRLNRDGSNDPTFTRRQGSYSALALQPDGKILAAFLDGIDRLNPDGSLDASFHVELGPPESSGTSAIIVQPDGKALIGGVFNTVNGVSVSGIARLNQNGSLDSTFSSDVVVGSVFALALQADGKVLVGGRFYNSLSVQNKSLLRLNSDGGLEATFTSATDSAGVVISLAVQPDGKVIAGGNFLVRNARNIARLNADGSVDHGFYAATANDTVFSVDLQSDGKVVIAGGFTEVNGAIRETLARLNANGSLDTDFNPEAGVDVTSGVAAVIAQADGKLLISGSFTHINGAMREGFARLETDGTLDVGFIPSRGLNNVVSSVIAQPDGKALIAGDFTAINSQTRNGIARLNPDGSLDASVFDRGSAGTFGPVTAIALQPDGKVLIGTRNGLVRTHSDGTLDAGFNAYSGPAATELAVQTDGKILFGGYIVEEFIDPDGVIETYYRAFLTRRNADGTRDTAFHETIGELSRGVGIADFAVQPDGKLLVAGSFNTFQGADRFGLVRLHPNGTVDAGFDARANNYVSSLVLQADGKLVIGGVFTTVNGSGRRRIARVFGDGSLDGSFDPGTGANDHITSIVRQANDKLLVVGYFTEFDGTARSRIVRLGPNGDLDYNFAPTPDERVFALALQADGNVLLGGAFTTVSGVVRPRVSRLFGDVLAPSLNASLSSGSVTISWPLSSGFVLDESLSIPGDWWETSLPYTTNVNIVSVSSPGGAGNKIYRLRKL